MNSQASSTPPKVSSGARESRLHGIRSRLLFWASLFGIFVLLIFLLGLAQRWNWISAELGPDPTGALSSAGTIYTCAMHPNIRQPTPGRCPICGMALVPAASGETGSGDDFAVRIEPAQRRLANIETAEAKSEPLSATLRTIGVIAIDESRQATIAAYVEGRLERLFADYTGVRINKGDHLAVIYSPQLFGAQAEYLAARRALDASNGALPPVRQAQEALVVNTLHRLQELGMTEEQLRQLEQQDKPQSRLTIYAPQGGTVVDKLAVEGNYVKAGDPIYRIAELSTVWLLLKLFPEDAAHVRFGQRVEAKVQSLPATTLVGRIAFIGPIVDASSRTVDIRVELNNEQHRLRPGDYAEGTIQLPIGPQGDVYDAELAGKWISPMHPQIIRNEPGQCPICGMELVPTSSYGYAAQPLPQPESLYVPRSAVLLAGGNSVIYVESEPGRFDLRPVVIGPILEDKIVILSGLKPSEKVATSGNFLIDSQMQLAGKPSLIDPTRMIAKKEKQDGPLQLPTSGITLVQGVAGEHLEQLYAAYFAVQQALALDQKPSAEVARALATTARRLAAEQSLPDSSLPLIKEVAAAAEHLEHQDLAEARKAFKAISRATVTLSTLVRGEQAQQSFTHFFCPMVPGGSGDWLQPGGDLLNPYFGSEMLHCGEEVAVYMPKPAPQVDAPTHPHESVPAKNKED